MAYGRDPSATALRNKASARVRAGVPWVRGAGCGGAERRWGPACSESLCWGPARGGEQGARPALGPPCRQGGEEVRSRRWALWGEPGDRPLAARAGGGPAQLPVSGAHNCCFHGASEICTGAAVAVSPGPSRTWLLSPVWPRSWSLRGRGPSQLRGQGCDGQPPVPSCGPQGHWVTSQRASGRQSAAQSQVGPGDGASVGACAGSRVFSQRCWWPWGWAGAGLPGSPSEVLG